MKVISTGDILILVFFFIYPPFFQVLPTGVISLEFWGVGLLGYRARKEPL